MRCPRALAALAGLLTLVGCSSSTGGKGHVNGPVVTLVCRSIGAAASADKQVVTARLSTLGADVATMTFSGPTMTIGARGLSAADLRTVCNRGSLSMRGLLAVPKAGDCTPAGATAAADAPAGVPVEACDGDGTAYRFGPAVVTDSDLTAADAVAPTAGVGQWTIALTLSAPAAARLATYTGAHSAQGGTNASARTCAATTTPCADFLGFVIDGVAESVPLSESPITGGLVQINGPFTRSSARLLATGLTSGRLPVPLSVVSVH